MLATDINTNQTADQIDVMEKRSDESIEQWLARTDRHCEELFVAEWYGLLERLWIAIGKEIDRERLLIYGQELANVPYGLLERAIKRIHKNYLYLAVPSIGEIWQAVNSELLEDGFRTVGEWIDARWENFLYRAKMENWGH